MTNRQRNEAILAEAREVTGNSRLALRDIVEWNASQTAVRLSIQPGEMMIHLPRCKMWAAVTERAGKVCSVCGCTWDRACEGGCSWVERREGEPPICSSCYRQPMLNL